MYGRGDPSYNGPPGESFESYATAQNQQPPGFYNPAQQHGQRNAHPQPQSVANIYQQHQHQLHHQQLQHQQAQLRQFQHIQHQQQINQISPSIPGSPITRNIGPTTYNPAASPFSFPMQSPSPGIGSPGQPYQNAGAHYPNPALSPVGNLGSPPGYPLGSPLMRQHPGMSQTQSASYGMPNVTSPIPSIAASPSSYQQLSPSRPPSAMAASALSPPPQHFDRPMPPARSVALNGPSMSAPAQPSVQPAVKPVFEIQEPPPEEPLPLYPTPEELEQIAATTKPLIPEGLLNRVFAKAGVSFVDPKIGSLIALTGQSIIADIIKDAVAVNKEIGKGNERVLTRAALEKALQDRGMKQLPPDLSTTFR